MDIGLIFTAGFAVLLALAALVGYSKGKKYVWQYTLTRLIINIAAVVIAIPVTKAVSLKAVGFILTKVEADGAIATLMDDLTVAMAVVEALAAMSLGLVFFFFIRIIVKAFLKLFKYSIFAVISAISDAFVKEKTPTEDSGIGEPDTVNAASSSEVAPEASFEAMPEEDAPTVAPTPERRRGREGCYALKPQFASILIGIIGCIFGVVVVFAPFTGAIALADDALAAVGEAMDDDDEVYDAYLMARSVTSNLSVRFTNKFGGKLIFNGLTTYKVDGTKIKLKNEAKLATAMAGSAVTIADEDESKAAKKKAVDEIVSAFDSSAVIPLVLSDVVNQVALSLEGDGELAELMDLEKPDDENSIIAKLISSFKGCTPDSIKQDVRTLGDILIIFIEHDAMDSIEDHEKLLSERELVEELLTVFFDNDRLSSLTSTFVEIGIDMLESELGMTDTLSKAHEKMLARFNEIDTTASKDDITAEVMQVLISYGIDVSEDGAYEVAQSLRLYGANTALSRVEVNGRNGTVDLSDPTVYTEVTLLLTKSEVKITHKDSIRDPEHEAHLIAESLFAITDLTDKVNSEADTGATLKAAGVILDNLSGTEIVGKDIVDKLVVVMFQSERITKALPMNTVEITRFVHSLVDGSDGKGKSYETIMTEVADMIDVLERLSLSDGSDDPVTAVTETIKNITPESAEALKHFVTDEFVKDIGIDSASSEGVSNVLTNLFDELATAKDKDGLGLSDEEYAEEAEKISNVLDVTMSITDGTQDTSGISIDGYVNDVMDSKILTNTIIGSVYGEGGELKNDPLGAGVELSDDEKTELVDSLSAKLDEANNAEYETEAEKAAKLAETEKLIIALGAYMNTEITIENGEVKLA